MTQITRKTQPAEIEAALAQAGDDFRSLEAIARKCTPTQVFECVVPWSSANRGEIAELLAGESGRTHIEISDDDRDGGWWTFEYAAGKVTVIRGKSGAADLGVHMNIFTWEELQRKELDPPKAYAQGKVRFSGNPAIGVRILGRMIKFLAGS